jgi:Transposase DDE domain
MIIAPRLPQGNSLFGRFSWKSLSGQHLLLMMIGILNHRGRMSAQQAASAIAGNSRHRASVGRFLKRHGPALSWLGHQCAGRLLALSSPRGQYVFIVDTTLVGHQGPHTPNTFSTGNRQRRPAQGRRYSKYRRAQRSCHAFVWGLLITPDGRRIPSVRCYFTPQYCQQHGQEHRTQADLAAELVRAVPTPAAAEVIVLGDTAFESRQLRAACDERGFYWIMPANPERVLAGAKPRPKLWSLSKQFRSARFAPIRFQPGQGPLAAMRRTRTTRRGSKAQPRTFYVHEERRAVHSVGAVRIVFSTKKRPERSKPLERDKMKILLSNASPLTVAQIVELHLLRWQIELFFKELKSSLGMHQYRFREFACVQAWMEMYRITFIYLEWIRAGHIRQATAARQKQHWNCQRSHGLALAVCQRIEEDQLGTFHRQTQTKAGLQKLRRLLRNALAPEYRNIA